MGVGCRCTQSVVGGSCRAAEGDESQPFLFCIGLLLAARAYATQKPGRRARLRLDAEETPPGQLGMDKGTEVEREGAGQKAPYIHVV